MTTEALNVENARAWIPINVLIDSTLKTLNIPIYDLDELPPWRCSGFVRLAAKELFDKNYAVSDSWDRRYDDFFVSKINEESLESLAGKGTLKPGMLIGLYYPDSEYNNDQDKKGKQVEYTHIALYLGISIKGEPLFAEQFGYSTIVRTESEFSDDHLIPKVILDSRS